MKFERNFLLIGFALAVLLPLVARNEYALHIGVMIMFSIILASSFNLIVGYVGEFPLGHTAFFGGGVACRDGDGRRERQRLQPLAGLGRFTHRDSYKFRSTLRLY